MSPNRRLCLATAAAAALSVPAAAQAASLVRPATGATRAALIRALVRQDGSSVGVTGAYLSRSHPSLAVVCQRTPDSGKVGFVFRHRGRSWSYATDSRSGSSRSALERGLERAC